MKEVKGNLWVYPTEIRVITTNGFVKGNGECVMGRGCAAEAKVKFPGMAVHLGSLIRRHGNRCFRLGYGVVSFPVKHHWREEADVELIVKSAQELVAMADKFGWTEVLLPRPGCGNGRLNWADVKPLLEQYLDDRFTVITFGVCVDVSDWKEVIYMTGRVVHCKRAAYDVYIGRPSQWGNPFAIGKDGSRQEVIAKYREWIMTQPHLLACLAELKGKTLGCWCYPQACHGDVLAELAESV